MSRQIRLPPRVQIREIDSQSGSYPTISRIGDDRTGRYTTQFDDTRTVLFTTASTISYPTTLEQSSRYLTSLSSSLTATGTIKKGIADQFVVFNSKIPDTKPFNESRHFEQSRDDVFFLSGSDYARLGSRFTSRLASKTKLEISIDPTTTYTAGFHYASGAGAVSDDASYKMLYYNHELQTWQGIFQGRKFQHGATPDVNLETQTIGFGPSLDFIGELITTNPEAIKNAARPTSIFGFPFDARYHATSSQAFDMSSLIDAPFLLEKVVYEFSASLTFPDEVGDVSELPILSFFILNQRRPAALTLNQTHTSTNTTTTITHSLPQSLQLTTGSTAENTYVDTIRDMVTYLQVTTITDEFSSTYPDHTHFVHRDLNISGSLVEDTLSWSGRYVMSASVRSPNFASAYGRLLPGGTSQDDLIDAGWLGGRSGRGVPMGRSFVNDIDGNVISGTIALGSLGDITLLTSQTQDNPYILLPTDKLIFGWDLPIGTLWPIADPGFRLSLHPGAGRIIFYGSLIKSAEYHDGLNQDLTSVSVHEIVGADNVLNEFDVEPNFLHSGTYAAQYVTGGMTTGLDSRRLIADAVQSSTPNVNQYRYLSSGSFIPGFSRTVSLASEHERYFDTLLPRPDKIAALNGADIFWESIAGSSARGSSIPLGHVYDDDASASLGINRDVTWNHAFPFEPKYSAVERMISLSRGWRPAKTSAGDTVSDNSVSKWISIRRSNPQTTSVSQTRLLVDSANLRVDADYTSLTPPSDRTFLLHYYGVGSGPSGSVGQRDAPAIPFNIVGEPIHRGFKYGIFNALPEHSKLIVRRDRYGQLRDVFEQRLYTKYYDTVGLNADGTLNGQPSVISSPVQINFVEPRTVTITQPTRTFSSNLSVEATSSMPYFDGVVRNREEPLNVTQINSGS